MEHNRLLKSAIIPFEEYESLMRDYVQKQKLQKRVDKAIECIENKEKELEEIKGYSVLGNDYWHFNMKLLEILKGSEK